MRQNLLEVGRRYSWRKRIIIKIILIVIKIIKTISVQEHSIPVLPHRQYRMMS